MNFLVAPDSFKGGMKAKEFCFTAKRVLESKGHTINCIPMTDGGEGCTEIITEIMGGKLLTCKASDANFFRKDARYGVCGDTAVTAVSECAYLPETMIKNPVYTTSSGLGEIIKLCRALGKKKVIIGLGGSATNDGGAGAVAALGGKFFDANGRDFIPVGGTLKDIVKIDLSEFLKNIEGMSFIALTDVKNPLLGDNGCSKIFAPQKGANREEVEILEANMRHYATQTAFLGVNHDFEGAGAAGGLGYCFKAFFNAEICLGADYVMEISGFEDKLISADVVITGEGKYDRTSVMGKICGKVKAAADSAGKKSVIFCGVAEDCVKSEFVVEINDNNSTLKENIAHSVENLSVALEKYFS